jgi:hypothetical protein
MYAAGAYLEGQMFLGYPTLATMAQRVEYQNMVMSIADDMTRKWIRLKAKAGVDKSDKIEAINDKLEALQMRDVFKQAIANDGYFGRGHIYIDTGDEDDAVELESSLGFGARSMMTAFKMPGKKINALRSIEPVWCYPHNYNTSDPLKPVWYVPQTWHVVSKMIHRSRLLTLISSPVSDLLKPAYSFGGIPLIQKAKPYVDNWLATRQNVHDATKCFSIWVFGTTMENILGGNKDDPNVGTRADIFNRYRRGQGMLMYDKEGEIRHCRRSRRRGQAQTRVLGHRALQQQAIDEAPNRLLGLVCPGVPLSADQPTRAVCRSSALLVAAARQWLIPQPLDYLDRLSTY